MTVDGEGFLMRKHHRLLNIAGVANVIAWLALGLTILILVSWMWEIFGQKGIGFYQQMIMDDPLFFARFVLNRFSELFHGLIYWLVLKGISLGLKMIVETDLNYRAVALEGSDE
jgi:hypothetical protein